MDKFLDCLLKVAKIILLLSIAYTAIWATINSEKLIPKKIEIFHRGYIEDSGLGFSYEEDYTD